LAHDAEWLMHLRSKERQSFFGSNHSLVRLEPNALDPHEAWGKDFHLEQRYLARDSEVRLLTLHQSKDPRRNELVRSGHSQLDMTGYLAECHFLLNIVPNVVVRDPDDFPSIRPSN